MSMSIGVNASVMTRQHLRFYAVERAGDLEPRSRTSAPAER